MTRDQIIADFTRDIKKFQQFARNIAGENHEDLFQECCLMLLEFPEARLLSYVNPTQGLKPFFIRMLINQYKSTTSKYHKEYRKQNAFIQTKGSDVVYNETALLMESEIEVEAADCIKARDNVHTLNGELFPSPLEEMVFALYVEHTSLRKALDAIPAEHAHLFDLKLVHTIVKKFRRTIKNYLNVVS